MKRLYHADMYRFTEPQPSWWEASPGDVRPEAEPLAGDESCEVAIIGGGYTGLSAAFHLCKRHGIEARVLEAGHIGWGASGRNAGFCGIGGTSLSVPRMLRKYGLEETRRFYRSQVEAVELVRSIIDDETIAAETMGEEELEVAHSRRAFEHLRRHAERQHDLLGLDTVVLPPEVFRERYFDTTDNHGAVVQRPCFALHPLRYVLGLASAAVRAGAMLHAHSEVLEWRKDGDTHTLVTRGGRLRCRKVILAANGFMPEHLHRAFYGRPLPMISAIVVTRPLRTDELAAQRWRTPQPAITSRNILNYFRLLPDNRFLFGGRGHSNGDSEGAVQNYAELALQLGHAFPHWRDVPIEYRWHGLICITMRLIPSIGQLQEDPSVFYAYGYHGNGVNTATWSGARLAEWLASGRQSAPSSVPSMMQGLSRRFPVAPLRLRYLQARLGLFRLQDAAG
ncbi:MAG TPA: FAD-binding oxidoreductase [Woeseiaceae bacterium]|nr:FAD-binding oxidoreductase [Woeseiaceae bacterium]